MSTPKYLSDSTKLKLAKVPKFIKNWMVLSLLATLMSFVAIGMFVNFPKSLTGHISLSSQNPEIALVSKVSGRFKLIVKNNDHVKAGDIIGYIETECEIPDLLLLDSLLEDNTLSNHEIIFTESPDLEGKILSLGPLQMDFEKLINYQDQISFIRNDTKVKDQLHSLSNQIDKINLKIASLLQQKQIALKALSVSADNFEIDKTLFREKVLSSYEFNKKQEEYFNNQKNFANLDFAIAESEELRERLQYETIQLNSVHEKTLLDLSRSLRAQKNLLKSKIKEFKENVMAISPINGIVNFASNMENNLFVKEGQDLVYILPNMTGITKAELLIPPFQAGEIIEGQKVIVRLDSYPYQKYGVLSGTVNSVSKKQENAILSIDVSFDQPIVSSTGFEFSLIEDASGTGEVIIEEQTLVQRIIYSLRSFHN